jgi:hypothetical protein
MQSKLSQAADAQESYRRSLLPLTTTYYLILTTYYLLLTTYYLLLTTDYLL